MTADSKKRTPDAEGEAATADVEADVADEDAPDPPMNRAERRLAAKQKRGRQAPTPAARNGMNTSGGSLRGRGVNSSGGPTKGTNTRRSG